MQHETSLHVPNSSVILLKYIKMKRETTETR